jgi:hypothetical protein
MLLALPLAVGMSRGLDFDVGVAGAPVLVVGDSMLVAAVEVTGMVLCWARESWLSYPHVSSLL